LSVRPLFVDLGREYRGGQHQALLLIKGLLSRGHTPELIAIRNSHLAKRARDAGVSVHAVDGRRLEAAWKIRQLVPGRRVDLVHANEPHALTSAWAAGAHHLVPLVAARRIALPLSSNPLALARYRASARIIAVSDFVRRSVVSSGLPASRVQVIYDGVEIPRSRSEAERMTAREQLAVPPEAICLLNLAALVPEKGHPLLIQAFARIREQFPACVLLLAGEGPERSGLQNIVRAQGIGDSVRFLGFVPEAERVYPAADLFIFPSQEEPLGSALLLAMAHGLPVVAVARGGIPEVVEDGKNGLLVKNLDAGEMAAAMVRLLSNPDEAGRLARAARETILEKFSADRMVNATFQLYEQLAGQRRRSTAENPAEV
jgi:glycosyltransferase involved in cell wall biosynthesis